MTDQVLLCYLQALKVDKGSKGSLVNLRYEILGQFQNLQPKEIAK